MMATMDRMLSAGKFVSKQHRFQVAVYENRTS